MLSRFTKNRFLKFFSSPFILAIPLSVLILLLIPPIFNKYEMSIESNQFLDKNTNYRRYYVDINDDGLSERLDVYHYRGFSTSVVFFNNKASTIDQANIPGYYLESSKLLTADYDNNGIKEFYFFTYVDSSLYINSAELIGTNILSKQKFVTEFKLNNGKLDIDASGIGGADLNFDGFKEIIFTVTAGFTLQPRAVFAYDVKNDTLLRSPFSYAVSNTGFICDIDNDSIPEIILSSWAPGNTNPEIHKPYHDQSAWLIILDNTLNFKYEPIEFPGFTSRAQPWVYNYKKENYLAVYWFRKGAGKELIKIKVFDSRLNFISERTWDYNTNVEANAIIVNKTASKDLLWFIKKDVGKVEHLGFPDLRKVKGKNYIKTLSNCILYDVDMDGENEILTWSSDNKSLHIYRSNFSDLASIEFASENGSARMYSSKKNGNDPPQMFFQKDQQTYLVNYKKNKLFYLKYPFYILVYGVFVLFMNLIKYLQTKRIEEKYEIERQISELQIRTIKNQADPHFIFNALNSIGSVIYKEDKETSYDYLTSFSTLIRKVIVNSDKIQITLKEELEYVESYLKLEKFRFKEKFDYQIQIDKNIDTFIKVPRMVLQTYIENAIKHGIMNLDRKGILAININQDNKLLIICIEDNGIGRDRAKKYNKLSTGKGLGIMEKIYDLYSKLYNIEISHLIEDLSSEAGEVLGTRVTVKIPIKSGS